MAAKPRIVAGSDPGGLAVALIGSGVNYVLPMLAHRLARDGEGDIVGLDFIDRDNRPFDVAGPESSPGGVRPHGTTLASVLLDGDAVGRLVPVRIRLGEPRQFGGAAAFVAATPARIAVVAWSSATRADWEPFAQAAAAAQNILFVLPAGDGGLDLDKSPVYPAALKLPNALVVTVAGNDGRLLATANRGAATVDLAMPAAGVRAVAVDGAPVEVSGTVYAAARAARLAAREMSTRPVSSAAELKARLLGQAKKSGAEQIPLLSE